MYLVERAAEDLRDEAMSGLHAVERAVAACWGSVAQIASPELMEDNHDNLRRIELASMQVRRALDTATREIHEAVRNIDEVVL